MGLLNGSNGSAPAMTPLDVRPRTLLPAAPIKARPPSPPRKLTYRPIDPRILYRHFPSCPDVARSQPSRLTVTPHPSPSTLPDGPLVWGASFSDHMLTVQHLPGKGWQAPEIKPFANLELHPASAVLHYAPCLFEGMSAGASLKALEVAARRSRARDEAARVESGG